MTNRAHALRLAGLAVSAALLSGCAVFSPVQTSKPYIPADGVPFTIKGMELRNLLIVTSSKGSDGVVVGQAVNDGLESVKVTFAVPGGSSADLTVPANSGETISDVATKVTLPSVPAAPGALVELTVTTPESGANVIQVPVLINDLYYQDLMS